MNRSYEQELSPEVREKMKKNLVYISIFSIVMLFAGFSSAYIVTMGDSFWLKTPLPSGFWTSTVLIALSSLTYILAISFVKKNDLSKGKLLMVLTVLLGMSFIYFQFKGFGTLTESGIHPINNHIIVTDGRYGDYYEIKIGDRFLEVDGNNFLKGSQPLTDKEMAELKAFVQPFLEIDPEKNFVVKNYANPHTLYLSGYPLTVNNGQLLKQNGEELAYVDRLRLHQLAVNINDGRGDFFVKGQIGKDFNIYYQGEALQYKNRQLYWKNAPLSKYHQVKAMETADTASSFLFILVILHLLHIAGALIYLLRMTFATLSNQFSSDNTLRLRLGAIFWHFLGFLWLYLLLFLVFIH